MTDAILIALLCSFSAVAGAFVGGLAGLIPGLHPNTLCAIVIASLGGTAQLSDEALALSISCFLIGLLMAHSLTEMIPTAMLGIADDETVVSLLPSQRLYNLGRGDLVIDSVIVGGAGAVIMFAAIMLPTSLLMGAPLHLYSTIKPALGILLLSVALYAILSLQDRGRIVKSCAIFLVSGLIGLLVLTAQFPLLLTESIFSGLWSLDSSSFLLPAFSGLFAMPSLVWSTGSDKERPRSHGSGPGVDYRKVPALISSLPSSILVGWIPGITNAYAASLLTRRRHGSSSVVSADCSYLVTYSATNVGGSLQAILAMAVILRFRNGTLEAIGSSISTDSIAWSEFQSPPLLMLALLWSASLSIVVGIWIFRLIGTRAFSRASILGGPTVRRSMVILLVTLSFLLTGPFGLLVLLSCFTLGTWALSIGAPRVHLMGILLVPVIVFFLSR